LVCDPLAPTRNGYVLYDHADKRCRFVDMREHDHLYLPALSSRMIPDAPGDTSVKDLLAVAPEATFLSKAPDFVFCVTGCDTLKAGSTPLRLFVVNPSAPASPAEVCEAEAKVTVAARGARRNLNIKLPAEAFLQLMALAEEGALLVARHEFGSAARPKASDAFFFPLPAGWQLKAKAPAWWLAASGPGFELDCDREDSVGGKHAFDVSLAFEAGLLAPLLMQHRWINARAGKLAGPALIAAMLARQAA
ncbi:MAG: hypothetical protein HUK26_09025, partial [Duodenibacillus sp.]|nr:hypothetical protein [Duodenibacillus sp.]